ncbi:hypothetical protein C8R42DRAFT_683468 [Lentinula raphanica]|nr:hypothetical protein C8R42DRAFT_683468 [Lentinula raphanica]
MNHSHTRDNTNLTTFSLSETENNSDSDWLDIASNRESDSESVSSNYGLSRRSSISTGSSREEVEAWEGFIDDTQDEETAPKDLALHLPIPDNEQPQSPFISPDDSHVEERRVRDGLNQSLTSTLNTSRTGSHPSTVHNSLRDLRLSFPDPLNSSHDDLNGSYDRVPSSEDAIDFAEGNDLGSSQVDLTRAPLIQDPDLPPTKEMHDRSTFRNVQVESNVTLQVVLYGSTPKWSFVDELLRKYLAGRELAGTDTVETEPLKPLIFDRTNIHSLPRSDYNPNRPSLAIVFHPFVHVVMPEHTAYLPVVTSEDDENFEKEFLEAQTTWASYHIPPNQVLRLEGSSSSLVFATEDVDKLDPYHSYQAIQRVLRQEKPASWLGIFEQFNAVHAVTLFALLCIIAGFSINTAIRVQPLQGIAVFLPSPTISSKGDSNQTTAVALRRSSNISVIHASPSRALTLYDRGTMSSVVAVSSGAMPTPSQAEDSSTTQGTLATWAERMRISKDVILRPSTSISALTSPEISLPSTSSASPSSTHHPHYGVATRLVDSLSELVATSMKALIEVVEHDLKDLMVAIDELMLALHRSTVAVIEQTQSATQSVWNHLEYRNARAQYQARALKARGKQLMSFAMSRIRGHTSNADPDAHSLEDADMFSGRDCKEHSKHGAGRARNRARRHNSHRMEVA